MEHSYEYLIIGGGMTADAAVGAIRERDPEGRIGLIGAEREPPYERPPLSKALWKGDKEVASIDLDTRRHRVDMHLGRRATALHRADKTVRDDQGDTYRYDKLLLATGARARTLPFEGERVIAFRTQDDYLRLRRFAVEGAHVAVVGGGFIGAELAASLTDAGCKVSMVFPGDAIGAGRFSDGLADFLNDYYRQRGVDLRPGVKVEDGKASDDGVSLTLSDGSTLTADVAAAGLGVEPETALAEQAGLMVDNGIVVDARLRTADPAIWAAGDVACFPSLALGHRRRVEHENAAISMGHHAGCGMAGEDRAYTTQPFFYSDLFDLGYEAVGELDARRLEVVEHWAEPYRRGVTYYMDGGRVRGVLLWNVWGQTDAAAELIAAPGPYDGDNLRHRIPMG
ncbi:NAD(P)/FAD-dependent oxidoreductase [Oleiagrimonas soli]|uniref:NADPH-dependent 2,4-dienoyl-CoA reductase/sulfur reductase-like enzyme n=1 Tax=Oleiagrimonas soli TaxID=1543381 RepID=A0A099CUJ1_9GAMM|nr:FAD-dependent oxidoreductase [Oleiagrimonas soli]KGI76675.1 pyridine nucleotide-disulfide oxidoreductase [Oleiagrimonas soli]MBB6185113.1 NADPH-dependent 2,4-dienoyl-CoA reductase/sulfur reductase-like enzyme [Oleiagrimonas soli]